MHTKSIEHLLTLPEFSIRKIPHGDHDSLVIDESVAWVGEILNELNDNQNELTTNLSIEFHLSKKMSHEFHEHILIEGQVSGQYQTQCVRCLEPMNCKIDVEINACFIDDEYQNEPEYQDILSVFTNNREYELYFYHKMNVAFSEFMHEQIFLGREPLPLHDENCQGLCQTCGINLNHETCKHTP